MRLVCLTAVCAALFAAGPALAQTELQQPEGEEPAPELPETHTAPVDPAPAPLQTEPATQQLDPGYSWAPTTPAVAPQADVAPEVDSGPSRDMSRDFWQFSVGARVSRITDGGFDPFAGNNTLGQVSLSATRALFIAGDFSFAAGPIWEVGSRSDTARGQPSMLVVHRFGAVAEGRYHLVRDLYALAKLVPHAIYDRASIDDASIGWELQQRAWAFGLDATAGAAWNFPRTFGAVDGVPQLWLGGEIGYGFATASDLVLEPDIDDADPQSRIALDLGDLALGGWMMRVTGAMTF